MSLLSARVEAGISPSVERRTVKEFHKQKEEAKMLAVFDSFQNIAPKWFEREKGR